MSLISRAEGKVSLSGEFEIRSTLVCDTSSSPSSLRCAIYLMRIRIETGGIVWYVPGLVRFILSHGKGRDGVALRMY